MSEPARSLTVRLMGGRFPFQRVIRKERGLLRFVAICVFIRLLAGREYGMLLARGGAMRDRRVLGLMRRDLLYAAIGLAVSILLALATNPSLFR